MTRTAHCSNKTLLRNRSNSVGNITLNLFFVILCLLCILPVVLVFVISFSGQESIAKVGYSLFPQEWSLEAYKVMFSSYDTILNAYWISIAVTVIGTLLSVAVISLYSYAISRNYFKYRKFFTFYIFFTMMFSGGLVAWYMVCTTVLNINNTIWALILPYTMNAWHVLVLKSFFTSSIPDAVIESGKLDGAKEFKIFMRLVLPISLPGIATIALFTTLIYWNDWWLPMLLNTNPSLYNLQFLLQSMMKNIELLSQNQSFMNNGAQQLANLPTDSMRMALCVIALGPILIIYPFFQKYFVQGLAVGAIKG